MNKSEEKTVVRVAAVCALCLVFAACSSQESKAVGELVKTTTSAVPETQSVGRILEVVSVLDQAQGLDSKEQCRAASRLYCEMFQMVRDGCLDTHTQSFCQTVANTFYGGSFPAFGMTICMDIAGDKCNELIPHKRRLQQLCLELMRQCQ